MSRGGHIPIRTCVGCRKKRRKEEMFWLIQQPEGVVMVNPKTPHQGRGFYLCPDLQCLKMAKKKNRGRISLEGLDFQHLAYKGSFAQEVGNGEK